MSALVNTDDIVVMNAEEARAKTDRAKVAVEATWELVKDLYLNRAWAALGYPSWDDYCTREFGSARLRLPREERQEVVASLRDAGLSTRAIEAATGVSRPTVIKDLREHEQVVKSSPPALAPPAPATPSPRPAPKVQGTDGKTYQSTKPSTPSATAPEKNAERRPSGTPTSTRWDAVKAHREEIDAYREKQEVKAPRRPFPDAMSKALTECSKSVERLVHLADDDRFPAYREKHETAFRNQLTTVIETYRALLDGTDNDEVTP